MSTAGSRAGDAWQALDAALHRYTPPCKGRAVFTADRLDDDEREYCERLCGRCLVSDLCDDYAIAAKVDSGFWAGSSRSPKRRQAEQQAPP